LIDTGEKGNWEYLQNLKSLLAEEKARISQIVLTHWHSDHTGGLAGVLSSGCTIDQPKLRKFKREEEGQNFPDFLRDGEQLTVEGATIKYVN
jgi:glyoxylase-like metal-dependent hydrolase (beta-lactamase superfamily II)